jgi:hypothetical protein
MSNGVVRYDFTNSLLLGLMRDQFAALAATEAEGPSEVTPKGSYNCRY